jgi:site-specific DNA-methyltransferase (adenine-specific)
VNVALDTDRFSLIQGDSLAVLKTFASKSFDVACFDPPYSPHVHEHFGKERRNDGQVVPDALTFPPMTPELISQVMAEVVRVTKTWILITTDFYNTHLWGEAAQASGGAWVRTGQWVKTNPKPQMTADRPGCGAEDILIAHAQPDTVQGRRSWDWNGGGHAATWRGRRDTTYHDDRGTGHPNQKPAWLLQSLLGMFCAPGALVLDPYLGSATTVLGALATERFEGESAAETSCPKCAKKILEQYQPPLPQNVSVVGVEGDPKYLELAISRIRGAVPTYLAA